MSKQEVLKRVLKESPKFLFPLSLLAISLLSVHFSKTKDGFKITKESDLDQLPNERTNRDPERRVALKLLELGIQINYESISIILDKPVEVAGTDKKTGKSKVKSMTTPDFNIQLDGIDIYLEIGSRKLTPHKRRQLSVIRRVVELKKNKRFLYLQLFKDDIDFIEENIETKEDFLDYLLKHQRAISSL
ncbi:MAG: hypothetical protein OEX81_04550 [Candidatus Pacebacteria bacterium]|nr:hypothetical protein [Candidatus Paceibacterota bacterium]